MKISLKQAYEAQGALIEAGRILTGKNGYRLGRITEAVTREIERAEKQRIEMIRAYNCPNPDEKIGGFKVPKEHDEEFQKMWTEMLTVEVEFWGSPFKWSELGEAAEKIPGSVFASLIWLFEEEGATEATEKTAGVGA